MKPLIIIPARGGSKGLPGKNIKPLAGKPLIHYSIEAAREILADEFICISTDSEEIRSVAEETGIRVSFMRPPALATDTAGSQEVLLHAHDYYANHQNYNADTIILLQVTSPFRTGKHISEALKLYSSALDGVFSVKETDANPYSVLKEENSLGFLEPSKEGSFTRRQDCPKVYELNGAIYIINVESLKTKKISDFNKVKKYLMSKRDSIDIDDAIDFLLAESIAQKII